MARLSHFSIFLWDVLTLEGQLELELRAFEMKRKANNFEIEKLQMSSGRALGA